ncbi:hypothetical protein AAEX28_00880 [Lentisphaerota bacterium WC36G]|nr:hypothetical protein LJT99_03760 [Lentisphaerae bacterium WC36]
MIVPMYKAALVCMNSDKDNALKNLRDFGAMHVEVDANNELSHTLQETVQRYDASKLMMLMVKEHEHVAANIEKKELANLKKESIEHIFDNALHLVARDNDIAKEIDSLRQDHEVLSAWGNFCNDQLKELENRGIYVYLCSAHEKDYLEFADKYVTQLISFSKKAHKFVIISEDQLDIDELMLPVENLPTKSLDEVDATLKHLRKEQRKNQEILGSYNHRYEDLKFYQAEVMELIEFVANQDSMNDSESGDLSFIHGYIPKENADEFKKFALEHGWAIQFEEPADDDRHVPTFLRVPKIFRISQPIFDFIGVSPGYKENDISICFLIFLTIFFAMIVGDAGYGMLFLSAAIAGKVFLKNPKMKLTLNLTIVMSTATIIWGILNASYFGIPAEVLPKFLIGPTKLFTTLPSWVHGTMVESFQNKLTNLPNIADEVVRKAKETEILGMIKQNNVIYLCFLLAAIHLSIGRFWIFLVDFKKNFRVALGCIGWALFVWANFFMAVDLVSYTGSFPQIGYYFYGIGIVLMLAGLTKDDVMNFPFAVIGSFVDVLSYIRLFAVGLAGFYIAYNFNVLGADLVKGGGLGSALGVVVILFGHALNITLALLGILVHGIRLNTLEFSNHIGLQWLGIRYNPFKRKIENNEIIDSK